MKLRFYGAIKSNPGINNEGEGELQFYKEIEGNYNNISHKNMKQHIHKNNERVTSSISKRQ